VRFEIRRDGELTMARLERSTGVAALDHEALALLRRGGLPALPDGWPHPTAAFVVPVTFDLR
jgi:protein TonB